MWHLIGFPFQRPQHPFTAMIKCAREYVHFLFRWLPSGTSPVTNLVIATAEDFEIRNLDDGIFVQWYYFLRSYVYRRCGEHVNLIFFFFLQT